MRFKHFALVLAGVVSAGSASGQGATPAGPPDKAIERHWPGEQPSNSNAGKVRWDGVDAVGLQLRGPNGAANAVVPVSLLKIPNGARREMDKSDKALKAGDIAGSADHLEKMLELMPDFAIGHNGLGARYVALGKYDRAMEEFRKAVALQPKYRLAVDNMTVTLCAQHRYEEAEPVARWALQLEPQAASSKYLLGSVLVSEDKPTGEAAQLLRSVQDNYPRARLFLAKVYEARGESDNAMEELREYLKSPRASDNGVTKEWLARLENEAAAGQATVSGVHD